MIIRVAHGLPAEGRALATAIAACVADRTYTAALTGTLMLGAGDPLILRGGETTPRVLMPLAWHHRVNRIGRDQIAHADAIVVLSAEELPPVRHAVRSDQVVVIAAPPSQNTSAFLGLTNPYEAIEAATSLGSHAALRAALPGLAGIDEVLRAVVDTASSGVVEAFLAVSCISHPRDQDTTTRR